MKRISFALAVFSATVITGCAQITEIAKKFAAGETVSGAAPYIYLSTFKYDGNLSICLDNAESALRKNGFTEHFARDLKDEYGTITADNPRGLVAAKIECDMKIGSSALAVSSQNNNAAYDSYKKLSDAEW